MRLAQCRLIVYPAMMIESEKTVQISQVSVNATDSSQRAERDDVVAIEEPMEIRVVSGPQDQRKGRSLSITMRTPGNDFELAAGFLVSEGIVNARSQIVNIEHCGPIPAGQPTPNTVRVELSPETEFDTKKFQRHFYTTSSCGVCGKASLDALDYQNFRPVESSMQVAGQTLMNLPDYMRQEQQVFAHTGGIHAAGLFDREGNMLTIREDVGRHNAMDKLVGHHFLTETRLLPESIVVVSGRASFELLQKALASRVPVFVAVGAPSSLAVELAQHYSVTLVGFASKKRINIYTHSNRVV